LVVRFFFVSFYYRACIGGTVIVGEDIGHVYQGVIQNWRQLYK